MVVTHIHLANAQQAQMELLAALGSENNPTQWIEFMQTTEKHLAFLFEAGRPTKKQIENSVIGQLGFSSWSEMIETDQDKQGLSWSVNTWKQWSKAYKLVKEFNYLADMKLTASAVMKLKSQFKDIEFPNSAESLEQAKAELIEKKKQDEDNKVSALNERIIELEKQLAAAAATVEVLEKQSSTLAEQERKLVSLETEQVKLIDENKKLEQKNTDLLCELKAHKQQGRWSHFLKVFTG